MPTAADQDRTQEQKVALTTTITKLLIQVKPGDKTAIDMTSVLNSAECKAVPSPAFQKELQRLQSKAEMKPEPAKKPSTIPSSRASTGAPVSHPELIIDNTE